MSRGVLILAGGQGKRLGGVEKGLLEVEGQPIICRLINVAREVAEEVVVSCRDEEQAEKYRGIVDVPVVVDEKTDVGPLMGIYSGFRVMESEYVAVLACDMPRVDMGVLEKLFESARACDVVVPCWPDGRMEPLCAVYRRGAFVEGAERVLGEGRKRIIFAFEGLRVMKVRVEELGEEAFFNVNKPEELRQL